MIQLPIVFMATSPTQEKSTDGVFNESISDSTDMA